MRQSLLLLVLSSLGAPLLAQDREASWGQTHDPAQGYRWQEEAKTLGLCEEDIAKLDREKVLLTNEAFKQVFDPYIHTGVTQFITSDSLLNAFHVLYEESILHLEQANAKRLPEVLSSLWQRVPPIAATMKGRPELVAAARRRAQVVVGTAMALLGMDPKTDDADLSKLIAEEAARVTAATGTLKPEWLGPPDPGFVAVDYSRYQPRGFYERSEDLARYFRAVSWLQSIPFRPAIEEEFLSIFLLGLALNPSHRVGDEPRGTGREHEGFFDCFSTFLGAGDDRDLSWWCRSHSSEWEHLDLEGRTVAEAIGFGAESAMKGDRDAKINDQVCFAPEGTGPVEVNFRILSARRTPDAVLFQRTTRIEGIEPRWPTGLEVCVELGSARARDLLPAKDRERVLATIDEARPLFEGRSLYVRYLDCLRALVDAPEPDAPAFMSTEAWQDKSCQTVLAGWAQMRHTWALQAKQTVEYLGLTRVPPGFVEPEPEFFARMAALAERTEEALTRADAFEPDLPGLAEQLRKVADLLLRFSTAKKPAQAMESASEEERALLEGPGMFVYVIEVKADRSDQAAYFVEASAGLRKLATDMANGVRPSLPHFDEVLAMMQIDLRPMWRAFERVCRRLEALAHKQLRGVALSEEEEAFLKVYGKEIAGLMLYGGNSYLTPKDDAPRVVDVHASAAAGKVLEVGISRPHALWVLYPVKGGEVLCKGTVMPYYEFAHEGRLGDAEWRKVLDSADRPPLPGWIQPLVGKDGFAPERVRKDH